MAAFRPDPPRSITPVAPPSDAPRGVAAPVARVIEAFRRLPGIGPKSAQRLAYHLVRMPEAEAAELSEAITGVKQRIKLCETCADITEEPVCAICSNRSRDRTVICVVEEPLDLLAIERTGLYAGLYHVLHGSLSPLEGRNVEDVRIGELVERLQAQPVDELILAMDADHEGDTTASYVAQVSAGYASRITRLARGLPTGADLEYADESTIASALQGRQDSA